MKKPRAGRVRVVGQSLVDNGGPFLGLGVSYFTALWRCKYDRQRLESDLAFLSAQGFNYYRMLSMVGWYGAWNNLEIAPVSFTSREGKSVAAWPDYWEQLRTLIDLAYDRHGLRTQITIFADAQLIPDKAERIEHLRKLLTSVLPGRESKVILLEVANEAWQNGFPAAQGVSDLRELTKYLGQRTQIPVAITSNHESDFRELYAGSGADIATWHFSRDRKPDSGWKPVYDCSDLAMQPGCPPVSSNEPIGPGASVNVETDPIRLVMAAAFAYVARLPMYVFHSDAGVFGKTRFSVMPAIDKFGPLLRLLPPDTPSWNRNDGKQPEAPFTTVSAGTADGCVRNIGARKGRRFVCVPIGIQPGGLVLEACAPLRCEVFDPLTGNSVLSQKCKPRQRLTLPQGPGAYLIKGEVESLNRA